MGDFFTNPQPQITTQYLPGTADAAARENGLLANARVAAMQGDIERQKLMQQDQQFNATNALDQQKLGLLAKQTNAGLAIDQQNANMNQIQTALNIQKQQQDMQSQKQDQELMAKAGEEWQKGNVDGWAKIMGQKDPGMVSTVMKNAEATKTQMLTQEHLNLSNEKDKQVIAKQNAAIVTPILEQLTNVPPDKIGEALKPYQDSLKAAGINLDANSTHDQVVGALAAAKQLSKGDQKPLSGDAAKLSFNLAQGVTGVHDIMTFMQNAGNDPALLKAKWQPNVMAKDSKYQQINAAAAMLQAAVQNIETGASVAPEQQENYAKFQPAIGDTLETLVYKAKKLNTLLGGTMKLMQVDPKAMGVDPSWLDEGYYDNPQGGTKQPNVGQSVQTPNSHPLGKYANTPNAGGQ